ncbi:MAG: hypothetical protein KatS3mg046_461 [Bellilinea sp.]|nr:MAG: hypothetical protein KatS3mg046_461 [Bellilinea sp.]
MPIYVIKDDFDRLMAYHRLGWCQSCDIVFGLRTEPCGRLGFVVCPVCKSTLHAEEVSRERAKELVKPKTLGSIASIYLDELGYTE